MQAGSRLYLPLVKCAEHCVVVSSMEFPEAQLSQQGAWQQHPILDKQAKTVPALGIIRSLNMRTQIWAWIAGDEWLSELSPALSKHSHMSMGPYARPLTPSSGGGGRTLADPLL